MQDAVLVRVMNCARQFGDEFRRGASRNRLTLGHFIELSAVDELHAEIAGTLAFSVAHWPRPMTFSAIVRLRLFWRAR